MIHKKNSADNGLNQRLYPLSAAIEPTFSEVSDIIWCEIQQRSTCNLPNTKQIERTHYYHEHSNVYSHMIWLSTERELRGNDEKDNLKMCARSDPSM